MASMFKEYSFSFEVNERWERLDDPRDYGYDGYEDYMPAGLCIVDRLVISTFDEKTFQAVIWKNVPVKSSGIEPIEDFSYLERDCIGRPIPKSSRSELTFMAVENHDADFEIVYPHLDSIISCLGVSEDIDYIKSSLSGFLTKHKLTKTKKKGKTPTIDEKVYSSFLESVPHYLNRVNGTINENVLQKPTNGRERKILNVIGRTLTYAIYQLKILPLIPHVKVKGKSNPHTSKKKKLK